MVPDGEFQVLYQAQAAAGAGQPPGPSGPGGAGQPPTPGPPSPGGGRGVGIQAPSQGSIGSRTPGTTVGGVPGAPGGAGTGIVGVVSKSKDPSIRVYNGRSRYNEWQFLYTDVTNAGGTQTGPRPGRRVPQPSGGNQPPGGGRQPGTGPRPPIGPPSTFGQPPMQPGGDPQ
jgi:integrin beta 8